MLLLVALMARPAASQDGPPPGLPVGPWILAPSLNLGYQIDNNLFRSTDGTDDGGTETIGQANAGVVASLPFSNSLLSLNAAGTLRDYETVQLAENVARDFGVALDLRFRHGDRLRLSDRFRRDFARLRELDALGNEVRFTGEPYDINQWQVELSREVPRQQGYLMRVRRTDFVFKGESPGGFFDYRGFDSLFEYRQPLPGDRWWTLAYVQRRFNDYASATPDQVGIPIRKEEGDALESGLRGRLGRDQFFDVRLGLVRYRLVDLDEPGEPGSESRYSGVVAQADWQTRLGRGTRLELGFNRQPLASTFDTYYILNELRANLRRDLGNRADVELTARFSQLDYGEQVGGCTRTDGLLDLEGQFSWRLHERLALRFSAQHEQRESNCDDDYHALVLGTGLSLGWF